MGGGTLDPLETKAVMTLRIAIPVRMNRTNGSRKARTIRTGMRIAVQTIHKAPKTISKTTCLSPVIEKRSFAVFMTTALLQSVNRSSLVALEHWTGKSWKSTAQSARPAIAFQVPAIVSIRFVKAHDNWTLERVRFSEKLARIAQRSLEALGVEVSLGSRVENIDADGVVVSGKRVPAKTVVRAAGVMASPAARWLRVEADNAAA